MMQGSDGRPLVWVTMTTDLGKYGLTILMNWYCYIFLQDLVICNTDVDLSLSNDNYNGNCAKLFC